MCGVELTLCLILPMSSTNESKSAPPGADDRLGEGAGVNVPPAEEVRCAICGQVCKGRRGLGVHRLLGRSMRLSSMLPTKWLRGLNPDGRQRTLDRLAAHEARLRVDGVPDRNINHSLSLAFRVNNPALRLAINLEYLCCHLHSVEGWWG